MKTDFTLRGTIFCTINDFPAYGNVLGTGIQLKEQKACPIGDEDMIDENLYLHYRTWLPLDHSFCKKEKLFNRKVEMREAHVPLCGKEGFNRVKYIEMVFDKLFKSVSKNLYKKRSKFLDLPYCE